MAKLDEAESIIERMAAQIRLWQESEDDRVYFLACYRLMEFSQRLYLPVPPLPHGE